MMAEQKRLEAGLAAAKARNAEVLKLYERIYEDNVSGKVNDEWFMQLSKKYEEEKAELKKRIFDLTERLNRLSGMQTAKDGFLRAIRSFMQMETLTPTVLHELIERIDIHAVQGRGKNRTQKIVIHYRFVGVIDFPYVQKTPVLLETRQGVAIRYVNGEQTAKASAERTELYQHSETPVPPKEKAVRRTCTATIKNSISGKKQSSVHTKPVRSVMNTRYVLQRRN